MLFSHRVPSHGLSAPSFTQHRGASPWDPELARKAARRLGQRPLILAHSGGHGISNFPHASRVCFGELLAWRIWRRWIVFEQIGASLLWDGDLDEEVILLGRRAVEGAVLDDVVRRHSAHASVPQHRED